MKTELDSGHTWFLESLSYCDDLELIVIEGFKSQDTETLTVGKSSIEDVHRVQPAANSRRYSIKFSQIVAWQVVDESYASYDKTEEQEEGRYLQTLKASSYLSYVKAHHGSYELIVGTGNHYRVWTENEIVDIVSCVQPTIKLLPNQAL